MSNRVIQSPIESYGLIPIHTESDIVAQGRKKLHKGAQESYRVIQRQRKSYRVIECRGCLKKR